MSSCKYCRKHVNPNENAEFRLHDRCVYRYKAFLARRRSEKASLAKQSHRVENAQNHRRDTSNFHMAIEKLMAMTPPMGLGTNACAAANEET